MAPEEQPFFCFFFFFFFFFSGFVYAVPGGFPEGGRVIGGIAVLMGVMCTPDTLPSVRGVVRVLLLTNHPALDAPLPRRGGFSESGEGLQNEKSFNSTGYHKCCDARGSLRWTLEDDR
jgi:hypothetical protein